MSIQLVDDETTMELEEFTPFFICVTLSRQIKSSTELNSLSLISIA